MQRLTPKIPFKYQHTDYDCSPTSLLNAIRLHCDSIPEDIHDRISRMTTAQGTTNTRFRKAAEFLNKRPYSLFDQEPMAITTTEFGEEQADLSKLIPIIQSSPKPQALLASIWYKTIPHEILILGAIQDNYWVAVFDPDLTKQAIRDFTSQDNPRNFHLFPGQTQAHNLLVRLDHINAHEDNHYQMGSYERHVTLITFG